MPRVGAPRVPATPVTEQQESRQAAILRAAVRLGRSKGIDHISAQEIAATAGVALRTLYRYYPTKYNVYAAVLSDQVQGLQPPAVTTGDPARDVEELMANACASMLEHPDLAHAMITSMQAVRARSGSVVGNEMRDLILATAGVTDPTTEQCRVARLIEQVTFGILTWAVGGQLDSEQAVDDARLACRLLLAEPR